MNLFGEDMIIGDFKLSDYGLMLASFENDSGTGEYELGTEHETIEEYIGNNPVPRYLGAKYSNKLRPTATIIKNPCTNKNNTYFTEHECRDILRQLTGFYGYKEMQILSSEFDELLYFRVRINKVSYQKVGGNVVGILLYMECDSQFAIQFYNLSDDLYNYLKPNVEIIILSDIDELNIINLTDNNWTSTIKNLKKDETIMIDCKNEKLKSSDSEHLILNDFNMHFMRFVNGINKLAIDKDIKLTISFKFPRKVGFV